MALKFHHYEDLPLANPPLREVICQVNFAPLLEIVRNLPTDFQSKIRNRFPKFAVRQTVGLDASQPLPSEYEFKSASDHSSASLAFSFVALATREYSHWGAFQDEMQGVLQAFTDVYGDILTTRIGLRFINELSASNLEVKDSEELLGVLNDDLTCLIVNAAWTTPKSAFHQLSLEDGDDELTIRVNFDRKSEPKIILDFDFFTTLNTPIATAVPDIIRTLQEFHINCYDVFRWSIKEDKIHLLKPAG